jgi:hypothetical protein
MSQKTDEELIKIVTTNCSKYQLIAVESAKKEIELRKIDTTKFQEIVEKVNIENQKQNELENNTVNSGIRFTPIARISDFSDNDSADLQSVPTKRMIEQEIMPV